MLSDVSIRNDCLLKADNNLIKRVKYNSESKKMYSSIFLPEDNIELLTVRFLW